MVNTSIISYLGFIPIFFLLFLVLFGALILFLISKNKIKKILILIPLSIIVLICFYIWFTIYSVKESISDFKEKTSEVNLKKLYEATTSPEELIEVGQVYTLTGNLMFRGYKGKMNYSILNHNSTRRDSISILYDYFNLAIDYPDGSYMWNVIYMDSIEIKKILEYKYENLKRKGEVVEMVLKTEKLSDNEWLCLKILDAEIKKGKTKMYD